jgi:ketosteroid isomerase-like protein
VSDGADREETLARVSSAFARKDQEAVLAAMSESIEIVVPGGTSFAGTYTGKTEAFWWLLRMRDAFVPAERGVTFSHVDDDMVVRQMAQVGSGQFMNVFRFTFDGSLIERIVWEPDDIETFDALIERVFP